ncbi:MAG: OsmC family protein [Actinomycetota bacterium]
MTTATSRLNDVDIAAVGELSAAVSGDPAKGATTWASEVRWRGGFRSEATVRGFEPVPSDEPAGLGGTDTAANPVEQLLGALGNCLAVGYAANATGLGIELRDVRIEVEGDLDLQTFLGLADGNAGFETITARVHLDADADDEALEALHRKVTSTSPVGHTLQRAVPTAIELA